MELKPNEPAASPSPAGMPPRAIAAQASRDNQRALLLWATVGLACFLASRFVPESAQMLLAICQWLSVFMAVVYIGRLFQSRRLEAWLKYNASVQTVVDWSDVPSARPASMQNFAIRAFASLADAESRGWSFYEPRARFEGEVCPNWAAFLGNGGQEVFRFDGLATGMNLAVVPENIRIFGKLRYLHCPSQALPAAAPAIALIAPVPKPEGALPGAPASAA